jgi:acyl-CoA dehydrogenase
LAAVLVRRTLLEPEHVEFGKSVRVFIDREIRPHFDRWEADGIVDSGLYAKAGDAGLMGLKAPIEFGGGGAEDMRFEAVMLEELAGSGVMNGGQGIVNHQLVVGYITQLGTPEQKRHWLPGLAAGTTLGGIAMTEPGTGSDLNAITTKAVREGDAYVLSGSKMFISSGMLGQLYIVVARTGSTDSRRNELTLLVVEDGMEGFSRGRNLKKIGQWSADTGELHFDGVRVPIDNVLGEVGQGFSHLMTNLPAERLSIAISSLAHAEAAFGWTLEYVKSRRVFGKPVGMFQNSRFMMATMRTELDIARVFVDRQIEASNSDELSAGRRPSRCRARCASWPS